MSTLILPVAGKSSRFNDMRPKWLLTMPDGKLMYEKSIESLEVDKFDRVVVTCLKEHIEKYVSLEKLKDSAKKNIDKRIEFLVLDKPTASHSETIYETLTKMSIKGSFYLKDCDNIFSTSYISENSIAVISLNDIDLVDAKNKSYVDVDVFGNVENIVEKNVISNLFCCGGYSFNDANEFIENFNDIQNQNIDNDEIYISHIIYNMLLKGKTFKIHKADNYIDWGTEREYRHYCKKFITVFCDVDGVLLKNGAKFSPNGWATDSIKSNVESFASLQKQGVLYFVITTSRPKSEIPYITDKLSELGLNVDAFLTDLPHTKRVLVNDFSKTNPYPSSIAINLERDSEELSNYLIHLTS